MEMKPYGFPYLIPCPINFLVGRKVFFSCNSRCSKSNIIVFRELQDKGFPLKKWQDWVNARNNPMSPISWCEFQQYIYTIPGIVSFTQQKYFLNASNVIPKKL